MIEKPKIYVATLLGRRYMANDQLLLAEFMVYWKNSYAWDQTGSYPALTFGATGEVIRYEIQGNIELAPSYLQP